MKFQILSALALATPTLGRQLAQNTLCGDSSQCARNCQDGTYHIVSNPAGGDTYFGCALSSITNYKYVQCRTTIQSNNIATHQVCQGVGGRSCTKHYDRSSMGYCVILIDNEDTFAQDCAATGSGNKIERGNNFELTFQEASDSAGCSDF
ncbi:hypothetical protein HD806DRAFT_317292 [Xylariaceae sp. AK1471]|nr:hypothetical protein HD806DRAFT_317292 [Xylariaceae sp. AK1471]